MKQDDLAQIVGTAQSELSRIERGKREPNVYLALKIAHALGATVEDIFAGKDED